MADSSSPTEEYGDVEKYLRKLGFAEVTHDNILAQECSGRWYFVVNIPGTNAYQEFLVPRRVPGAVAVVKRNQEPNFEGRYRALCTWVVLVNLRTFYKPRSLSPEQKELLADWCGVTFIEHAWL